MHHMKRLVTACVLVIAVSATGAATATAKKKGKGLRPPTCDETIRVIQGTANLISADLAVAGFTPDSALGHNYGYSDTCRLIPPNKRRGTGIVVDYLPYGSDPNYEGQPFYEWRWYQTVTRTRKGKFTSTIEDHTCRYGVQTGTGIGGGRPC